MPLRSWDARACRRGCGLPPGVRFPDAALCRRFFGFVIGGSLPVALAANWLAGAWDQNSALYRATPGTAYLEQIALRWLLDVLGLPASCGGAFVTGATVANLCGLAAARHAVLQRAGWNSMAARRWGSCASMAAWR